MSIHFDALDRSGGNSETDDRVWLDENSTAAENQWSRASTTFYLSNTAPDKREQFERLYEWQHYRSSDNRSSELVDMRMHADADAFCSMLEFPASLQERVHHILRESDISSNNFGGKSYEKIILAVCTLVHDEQLSRHASADNGGVRRRLIFNDTFRELMEAANIGSKELRSTREQVRQKTNFF